MIWSLDVLIALLLCLHLVLWIKTDEGLFYWIARVFLLLRKLEIATYRAVVPAARCWWREFVTFEKEEKS